MLMQPRPCDRPVPLYSRGRDLKRFCCLVDREPGEVLQLDDSTQASVQPREIVECLVERKHIDARFRGPYREILQPDHRDSSTALAGGPSPCVIDQNLTHQARGHRQQVRSVPHVHVADIHKPEVRLMHKCRRLEYVAARLPAQASPR